MKVANNLLGLIFWFDKTLFPHNNSGRQVSLKTQQTAQVTFAATSCISNISAFSSSSSHPMFYWAGRKVVQVWLFGVNNLCKIREASLKSHKRVVLNRFTQVLLQSPDTFCFLQLNHKSFERCPIVSESFSQASVRCFLPVVRRGEIFGDFTLLCSKLQDFLASRRLRSGELKEFLRINIRWGARRGRKPLLTWTKLMIISSRRQSQGWAREKLMCSAITLTGLEPHMQTFLPKLLLSTS